MVSFRGDYKGYYKGSGLYISWAYQAYAADKPIGFLEGLGFRV